MLVIQERGSVRMKTKGRFLGFAGMVALLAFVGLSAFAQNQNMNSNMNSNGNINGNSNMNSNMNDHGSNSNSNMNPPSAKG